jgi:hypothetical protein
MKQIVLILAGLAFAGTLCVLVSAQSTRYAPPQTLCKLLFAP